MERRLDIDADATLIVHTIPVCRVARLRDAGADIVQVAGVFLLDGFERRTYHVTRLRVENVPHTEGVTLGSLNRVVVAGGAILRRAVRVHGSVCGLRPWQLYGLEISRHRRARNRI